MQPYLPPPPPHPWPSGLPYPTPVTWDPYATAVERPIEETPLDELCAEYAAVSRSIEATRIQRDALTEALTERRARRHALAVALPHLFAAEHGVTAPDAGAEPSAAAAVPWDLDSPPIEHRAAP